MGKVWTYQEPREWSFDGEMYTPHGTQQVWMSERAILSAYWPHWSKEMLRQGKHDQCTEESCIQDFVTVHWAWDAALNGGSGT